MTCGESKFNDTPERGMARSLLAVCAICAGSGATRCPSSGELVQVHVRGEKVCPQKKHQYFTWNGVVKWFGVWHIGVPLLYRVWLWYWAPIASDDLEGYINSFPGCGCMARLKIWWLNFLNRLQRRSRMIPAGLKCWAFLIVLAVVLAVLGSCDSDKPRPSGASQGANVKLAAGEIGKAAAAIDKEADAIVKEAPDTKPHTDAIGEQTDTLRVIQGRLDAAQAEIAARDKDCAEKDKQIVALEDEKKNGMRKRLISLVALGLMGMAVGIGIAVFGARAIGVAVAVTGGSLAGSALCFQVLLDYAVPITLGIVGVGAVLLLLYALGFKQVTHFAEQIKPITDKATINAIGNQTQSWFTRVIVGGIRKRLAAPQLSGK